MSLFVAEFSRPDEAAFQLFALGVDINTPCRQLAPRTNIEHVQIKDKCRLGNCLEPVNVVLVVGNRRILTRLERPGRLSV